MFRTKKYVNILIIINAIIIVIDFIELLKNFLLYPVLSSDKLITTNVIKHVIKLNGV